MIRTMVPLLLAGLTALATPSFAQVYTWKDESGRTVMSDKKPPPKARSERILKGTEPVTEDGAATPAATAAAPAPSGPPGVDPELEKRRKAQEQKIKAENEQKQREREKLAKQENETACKGYQQNIATLDAGLRVGGIDDKGELYFLDDEQREAERARLRKLIADNCR